MCSKRLPKVPLERPEAPRRPLILVRRHTDFDCFALRGSPRCHLRLPKRPRCPLILVRRCGEFEPHALREHKVPRKSLFEVPPEVPEHPKWPFILMILNFMP